MLVQSVSFHLQLDLAREPALPTSIIMLRVVVLCAFYLMMLLQTTSMLCDFECTSTTCFRRVLLGALSRP